MDNMPNVPMPKLRWSSLSFNVLRELSVQPRPRNLISISVCLFSPLQRPSATLNVVKYWPGWDDYTAERRSAFNITDTLPFARNKTSEEDTKGHLFLFTSSPNWLLAEMLLSLSFAKAILMVLFSVYCSCLLLNCIQTQVGDC